MRDMREFLNVYDLLFMHDITDDGVKRHRLH